MYSFYAADSGIECVAYGPNFGIASTTGPTELNCAGQKISLISYGIPIVQTSFPNTTGDKQNLHSTSVSIPDQLVSDVRKSA